MAVPLAFPAILIAMQAAGLVTDYRNEQKQMKLIGIGRTLEQKQMETNLEAIRLESSEASLDEMKQLRSNIGTQLVTQAARGNSMVGGSSASFITQNSFANFNKDERTRRLNLIAKEASLRGADVLSGLHTLQSETQLGQSLTKRVLNQIPLSSGVDMFRRTDLAKKWGFGMEPVK